MNSGFPFSGVAQSICFVIFVQSNQKLLITRDPLTELNNRKSFKEFASRKFKQDNASNLYILMIDGNKFKYINDTYGHIEGDRALIQIANCLREVVPRNFLICRLGGDEFAVTGDANSDEEIRILCDCIHSALQRANECNGKEWNVSISIGWTSFKKEFNIIPDFIEAADRELYKNKQNKIN